MNSPGATLRVNSVQHALVAVAHMEAIDFDSRRH